VDEADSPQYSFVQPMKAALYFDSADGFGEWRVLMSSRAEHDLRDARKRQPERFDIYMKKIKELSHGQFSADNQKRLTGPGTEVPIFEAKMTGDSRLVVCLTWCSGWPWTEAFHSTKLIACPSTTARFVSSTRPVQRFLTDAPS
jgi:hypothetical protein